MSDIEHTMQLNAAKAALEYIKEDQIIGVGTGRTTNVFIEQLAGIKHKIAGTVASSQATAQVLKSFSIPVLDFTAINELPIYFDGADAYNDLKQLVKGAGGALTREKILAYASKQFICMVTATKKNVLGEGALPVEVIPMARSVVARELVKLGGRPEYRQDFVTDNGNIILDVYDLNIDQPIELEHKLKQIVGVVENGLFAQRGANNILIGTQNGVTKL